MSNETQTQNEPVWIIIVKFLASCLYWISVLILGLFTTLLDSLLYLSRPLVKALQGFVSWYIDFMHGIILAATVVAIEVTKLYLKSVPMYHIKHSELPFVIKLISGLGLLGFATMIGIISIMIAVQGKEKIERYLIGRILMWILTPIFWIKDNVKILIKRFKKTYAYRYTKILYKRKFLPFWKNLMKN